MDLQVQSRAPTQVPVVELPVPMPVTPKTTAPVPPASQSTTCHQDVPQPEHEMTPQVSHRDPLMSQSFEVPRVERADSSGIQDAAPPEDSSQIPAPTSVEMSLPSPSVIPGTTDLSASTPLPADDDDFEEDAQICEECLLTSQDLGPPDANGDALFSFTSLHSGPQAQVAPLAEDNLPYVENPLVPKEHQAFCLEIPIKPKHLRKWAQESNPEQMVTLHP